MDPIATPEATPKTIGAPTTTTDTPDPTPRKRRKPKGPTKRRGLKGRHWTWGHLNVFRANRRRWTKEARLLRPTTRTTIPGLIFRTMERIKRGSDTHVFNEALKDGLQTISRRRNLYYRVQVELRLLAKMGVISREKHPKTTSLDASST